ncbi:porin family protein [Microvirga sp. 3-52]|jgi:outer membrane immunogenic protein|uniref:outer membrane protein n=1 Tax=Microvirga sp. 3-52 TaxID=2792425 RepID=UPI001AC7D9F8|nr:outer membrane protein [Microvirga sp. 3-52]MBO1906903.1 porin family protein [Microvirga sp. 3-52]MBS7454061.1 porin family protein [Microvirga sp. 3-52]
MRTSALGLLAATAALAIAASTAHAADLPGRYSPAPAYNALPVFTWTGFYAGLNAGYGWNVGDSRYYDPAFRNGKRSGGFIGGAQAGYNYQFGMFVGGLETDLQYAAVGNKGASYGTTYYPGDSDGFFGTIRARVGVAFDRALVYGTGGFAYGDIGGNRGYDPLLGYHSGDEVNWGWTLGGGVEYAITNNFTAKVEGLYVDLDTKDNYTLGGRVNVDRDAEFGVLRAGVNYKFN